MARGKFVTDAELQEVRATGISDDTIIRVARRLINETRKARANTVVGNVTTDNNTENNVNNNENE